MKFNRFFRFWAAALLLGALSLAAPAVAIERADDSQARVTDHDAELASALVEIDGKALFRVRGSSSYSPEKRAAAIVRRIEAFAADASVSVDAIRPVELGNGTAIVADGQALMTVLDADARLESLERKPLADIIVHNIREAVTDYRRARSREALLDSTMSAGVATVIAAVLVALVIWLSRRLDALLERLYRQRIHSVGIQSFQVVRAEQIWRLLKRALDGARMLVLVLLGFFYLDQVLRLFPWTRGIATHLLGYVIEPLGIMAQATAEAIPALLFLITLFFLTRFLLKFVHLFFLAVGRGEVRLSGFEAEWALPTYKLLRIGVVVLALIVAYPYIPGSDTGAFKGISIFIGVLFSLGSSSAIANLIAGYMMTYRRAFRVGDRIKIGDVTGDVTEMRLQVTHLKTIWNEEVTIPNSMILQGEVVNYSALARKGGLILHATVGISYETPWRQVEAMLLMAAERTRGLLKEPPPFVRLRHDALGAFAVSHEIDVYCDSAQAMGALYTELHRNILDVFNEYGVQIMVPAYEGDTKVPKVVPKELWFSPPAKVADAEPGPPLSL